MSKERKNPYFNINAKYEDMIDTAKEIVAYHEFSSNGTCEPPSYISLAYDVVNYMPKLQQENTQLKEKWRATNKGLRKVIIKRKKWKDRYYNERYKNKKLNSALKEMREYITDTPKVIRSIYFDQKKKDEEQAIIVFLNSTLKRELVEIIDKSLGDNDD